MNYHRHYAHTIHARNCHCGWNNALAPVLTVAPGETMLFECRDASDGQISPSSGPEAIMTLDGERTNPVTGPVYVDGAEPGDALKITIGEFIPSGFGWTAIIPGFGLLADDFRAPALHLWNYDASLSAPAAYSDIARIPLRPFAGTIGVAPAAPGRHSVIPPRNVGGNMDTRDIARGTVLYLPVEVEGALFSVGDTHAAQGDGEVCGTAIESAMDVEITLDLVKGAAPEMPWFTTSGPDRRGLDQDGYLVTTGIGPDLMAGAHSAVSRMIDLLGREHGLQPEDAYMLASVCGDLKISEIVDAPNWVVSFYFPRAVFA